MSEYENISKYLLKRTKLDICYGAVAAKYGDDNGPVYTVSKYCADEKKAMQFIDFIASPDIQLTIMYGPENLCWYVDEDGYYHMTDFGNECLNEPDTVMPKEYGSGTFLEGTLAYPLFDTFNKEDKNPDSIHGESFDENKWKK